MPFVNVRIAGGPLADGLLAELQRGITSLMADVLRKNPALTAVLVEQVAAGSWTIGAAPVHRAAHVDAIVSAHTNTPDEKARFLAATQALLQQVLGPGLPLATYVVVHEVPKDSWGYGGQTQAARAAADR